MNLVLDTNIYLAAMGLPGGFCHKLLDLLVKNKQDHFLNISPAILDEIRSAAAQMKNEGLIKEGTVELILSLIHQGTFLVHPKEKISGVVRHDKDHKILECAVVAEADLIITMDRDLLKIKGFRGCGIVHPKIFLHIIGK